MTTLLLDPTAQSNERALSRKPSLTDLVRIIRAEYIEMPGLHLTRTQARRLWNLEPGTCDELLDGLVAAGFLRRTAGDAFVRMAWAATGCEAPRGFC